MNVEEFRREAHRFVDWMADYLGSVGDYPVRSRLSPGDAVRDLPASPPRDPEPVDRIFEDFRESILPGITHWQHPRFFAYFPANASPPAVLAEMLVATLAPQCMLWQTSPAATELETHVLEWLRQMLGLPDGLIGCIQTTASDATACALIDARERALRWHGNQRGLAALGAEGVRLAVYVSEEAHSSIEKGAMIAGLGRESVRKIPTDARFAMRPEDLREAIERDRVAGVVPACVVATLGTTGTGGIDPLEEIGRISTDAGAYLHVDAAWAGSALLLDECRWMAEGADAADSIVVNPHKWMLTNFDCSAHFVRDPAAFTRTFSVQPAYLQTPDAAAVIDYRDWGIALGRRFRALKLWFVIRSYGVDGLTRLIRQHIEWAAGFADRVAAHPDFELVSPRSLSLFSFRYRPPELPEDEVDGLNRRLISALNDSGELYLTQNVVRGVFAIRFVVGQRSTTADDIERAWEVIRETAGGLTRSSGSPAGAGSDG